MTGGSPEMFNEFFVGCSDPKLDLADYSGMFLSLNKFAS